ncbi:hypothetical protein BEP19_15015 [Ammoniphilus oxalaticus]|uniref:Uncharacterized protein n=1 Tax=Ammoniphilus oxalaticus TaxID=66863 RepID=A0A419SD04_9BACL|nr:hypothetical protein [Ammoniphilus oxalaticus]RKD20992.1 hypothetical protein BEP19_15015 [Ammoniphilus oxalaticus]
MNQTNRVVPLRSPHRHRKKGDEDMQQNNNDRPVFTTQIGNTTIKIRSILPFMSPKERSEWFEENADLPEVKQMNRILAESLWALEEQESEKEDSHGA